MSVSSEVRDVENEIDSKIQSLQLWKTMRSVILRALMEFCEEFTTMVHKGALDAQLFESESEVLPILQLEQTKRTGAFWALKWTIEYSTEDGSEGNHPNWRSIRCVGGRSETCESG